MSEESGPIPMPPAPRDLAERLDLANRLYRAYHTRCFWHGPRDLAITAELLPYVVKGLRTHGGRRGFIRASQLLAGETPESTSADCAVLGQAAPEPGIPNR